MATALLSPYHLAAMSSDARPAPPPPAGATDEDLYRRFHEARDEAALDALIRRHWDRVFRLCWRVVRDPALAEDAAQRTFVALARAAGFRGDGPLAAFIARIALNEARKAARARRRREAHEGAAAARRGGAEGDGHGGDRDESDLAVAVDAHLQRLPDDLRLPLVLRYVEGMTHEEIAGALGLAPGTASSRLRRGLERLRDSLSRAGLAAAVPEVERLLGAIGAGAIDVLHPPAPPAAPGVEVVLLRAARAARRALAAKVASTVAGAAVAVALAAWSGLFSPAASSPPAGRAPLVAQARPDAGAGAAAPAGAADAASRDAGPAPAREGEAATGTGEGTASAPAGGAGRADPPGAPEAGPGEPSWARVLDAATRAPVAGAEVAVIGESWLSSLREGDFSAWEPWWESDGEGRLRARIPMAPFDEVPTATALIVVRADGYEPLVRLFSADALAPPVELLLERGPGCAVRGRAVQRGTGAPIGDLDLAIQIESKLPSLPRFSCAFEVTTDAGGRFDLRGLPPGRVRIEVREHQGGVGSGRQFTFADASRTPDEVVFDVDAPAALDVEVLDGAGRRLSGYEMTLIPAEGGGGQTIPASDDGLIGRGDLPPGKYRVEIRPERSQEDVLARVLRGGLKGEDILEALLAPKPPAVAAEDVTLAPGERRLLAIRLDERPEVSVVCRVRDEDGAPFAGAQVWAAPASAEGWAERVEGSTGAAGEATLALRAGKVKLRVIPSPERAGFLDGILAGEAPPAVVLEVGSSGATADLTVPRLLPLRGTVCDAGGVPVDGAQVEFRDQATGAKRTGRTGEDGRFDLGPLPRGGVSVQIEAPGRRRYSDAVEHRGEPFAFTLDAARSLVVRGTIAGAPRDLQGAEVAVCFDEGGDGSDPRRPNVWVNPRHLERGEVARDGTFRVEFTDLPAGRAGTLVVRVGEYAPIRVGAAGADERDVVLRDLALVPGLTLRGRVADPEGWLAQGGFGSASADGSWFAEFHRVKIAPDGRFEIRGLPGGEPVKVHLGIASPGPGESRWLRAEREVDPRTVPGGDLGVIELLPRLPGMPEADGSEVR